MSYVKRDESAVGNELGLSYHLDKTTVLQEARVFNESHINVRKCRLLLTKIVYLLYLSGPFGTKEATDLFFNVIKLFQSKDTSLRQMMYLVIKEIADTAEDVIMVTQSLIKDIQSKQDTIYRANAIRALCLITDPSMIQGIERILKACIVDKVPSVSSAALVSSYHIYDVAKDIVRRWSNEIQEAVHAHSSSGLSSNYISSFGNQAMSLSAPVISNSNISQYHALGLLYLVRQHDRMAVAKLVQTFSGSRGGGGGGFFGSGSGGGSPLKNPAAVCLLIRCASKVMEEDPSATRRIYELLDGYLKHKSDMVNLEAARAICEMPDMSSKELQPAITVLQLFLSSPKPTLRFAAIRILSKLSLTNPAAVAPCNIDMENLITDRNRSIATFAITTLLKTGNEASVDRLMKQISSFMSEISDEFKVIVVDAIRALCLKFPTKQAVMLSFLSSILRDEGGYDFKKAVVEAIFDMVKFISDCKDIALSHLCEFIEDCEFTKLSVRILHLLGIEGPKTTTPTKYIRYIYNRVILENSLVRAAAVSALAKFGVNVEDPQVKNSIRVLLTRCLDDVDDEVRDRATFYLSLMENSSLADEYLQDDATFALSSLERQLVEYVNSPLGNDRRFDLEAVPVISKADEEEEIRRVRAGDILPIPVTNGTTSSRSHLAGSPVPSSGKAIPVAPAGTSALDQQAIYAEELSKIPEFSAYGPLFKSSIKPIELTESETEYCVHCVKHTFANHVVFQFNCTNTLNDQVLENVQMVMQPEVDDMGLVQVAEIPAAKLEYGVKQSIYVAFEQQDYAIGGFSCTLKFLVKDCDPVTGEADPEGYEDEYQVEDTEVIMGDYIRPTYISNFADEWEKHAASEAIETFALDKEKAASLKAACISIRQLLSMQALEDSALPKSNTVHTLVLAGMFLGGIKVLARCRMTFDAVNGVAFELAIRNQADDDQVSNLILGAIV
ncbi:adaptin N terminal region-domain-containing protein [Dichotomocladium elegans]|nr:adaptin N terminal region-domain-containing protein [Dichotomocladium elegans]